MVHEVLAHTREIESWCDSKLIEFRTRPNTGAQKDSWATVCTSCKDDLLPCFVYNACSTRVSDLHTSGPEIFAVAVGFGDNLVHVLSGQNIDPRLRFLSPQIVGGTSPNALVDTSDGVTTTMGALSSGEHVLFERKAFRLE